jgi:hypothetical protein
MCRLYSRIWRFTICAGGIVLCGLCCGPCFGQQGSPAQSSQPPVSSAPPTDAPNATSPAASAPAPNSPPATTSAPLPNDPSTTAPAASTAAQASAPGQSSNPAANSTPVVVNGPAEPAYEQQQKRIMGMLPNFRSVSAGAIVPKETARQKLITATEDNYDYTSLFFAGIIAADSFVTKSTPEFHQGAAGYARYYWHTVADQSIENYFVELIIPSISHEDSRYYAMGKEGGSIWHRMGYSFSRVLITRTQTDKPTFNYSEILGSAGAASTSIFYYPGKERTVANGFRNWGLDITYDSVTFVFHEFWPDIRHGLVSKFGRKATTNP